MGRRVWKLNYSKIKDVKNTFQWWAHMDWRWYSAYRLVFPANLVNPTEMGYL